MSTCYDIEESQIKNHKIFLKNKKVLLNELKLIKLINCETWAIFEYNSFNEKQAEYIKENREKCKKEDQQTGADWIGLDSNDNKIRYSIRFNFTTFDIVTLRYIRGGKKEHETEYFKKLQQVKNNEERPDFLIQLNIDSMNEIDSYIIIKFDDFLLNVEERHSEGLIQIKTNEYKNGDIAQYMNILFNEAVNFCDSRYLCKIVRLKHHKTFDEEMDELIK